jgi:CubicO group peptidase (beta-lactamase class C family)
LNKKIIGVLIFLILTLNIPSAISITNLESSNIQLEANYNKDINSLNSYSTLDLDEFIIRFMDNNHIPGLSAAIVKRGRFLWNGAYGWGVLNSRPVKNSTIFWLASISKTITATALMQLYDQGLFELDDNINDYLSFQVINPLHPDVDITFFMLLTHTSGIIDNDDFIWKIFGTSEWIVPLGEFLENYLTPDGQYYSINNFEGKPGSSFEYSNVAA